MRKGGGLRGEAVPVALLLALSLLFFLSYFNRFAGLRSGDGEFSGGVAMLAHRLPYRDYYTAGPPLNQIKSAMELAVFGKTLFVSRLMGVVERLLIALALYGWLRRLFSAQAAMLAALVTIVVSAGDRTDPMASYNHDAIFLTMLCGFVASVSLDAERLRRVVGFSMLAGVAAGLSILSKQTVGLGAAVCVFVVAGIVGLRANGFRHTAWWCGGFVGGVVVPVVAVGGWLWRLGLLGECLTMMFVSGPAAKAARPLMFLQREWMVAAGNSVWVTLAVVAMVLSVGAVWRGVRVEKADEDEPRWLALALGCLVVIGTAMVLALTPLPALQDFGKSAVYFVLAGTAILGVVALTAGVRGRERRLLQAGLTAALSWSVAVTLSLSWPAFEAMALPGLGLLLAAAIDGARGWGRRFLYVVMAAMVFIQIREKLNLPFAFDHQEEAAVRFARRASGQPMLRGMRLATEEVRLFDDVSAAADAARSHGEHSGFTYPEMSLIYPVSGLEFPTRAGSHNIDVVPDEFAREEAARLLKARPAVIVYARPCEADLAADEAIWRGGRRSGQREMVAALDRIVVDYRLAGTYRLLPQDNEIRLYVRRWGDKSKDERKGR